MWEAFLHAFQGPAVSKKTSRLNHLNRGRKSAGNFLLLARILQLSKRSIVFLYLGFSSVARSRQTHILWYCAFPRFYCILFCPKSPCPKFANSLFLRHADVEEARVEITLFTSSHAISIHSMFWFISPLVRAMMSHDVFQHWSHLHLVMTALKARESTSKIEALRERLLSEA